MPLPACDPALALTPDDALAAGLHDAPLHLRGGTRVLILIDDQHTERARAEYASPEERAIIARHLTALLADLRVFDAASAAQSPPHRADGAMRSLTLITG